MTRPSDPRAPALFAKLPLVAQWGVLVAGSALLAEMFVLARLPAALLLGPIVAGVVVGSNGGRIRTPRLPVFASQTIVGCLVAQAIKGDIVLTFLKGWPLFLSVVMAIIVISTAIGLVLTRLKVVPGTTAVWGMAPGGASVMMLMAGAFGDDARLVAFMQYMRVVLVAAMASVVARLWVGVPGVAAPDVLWFPGLVWQDFAGTLLIAALGVVGLWLRIPAGALLVPMVVGAVLEGIGLVKITLPQCIPGLEHRTGVHARNPQARVACTAPGLAREPLPDCSMRRTGFRTGSCGRYRSIDGISRDKPGRHGFGRDHRGGEQCRSILRNGAADLAACDRADRRAAACAVHRAATDVTGQNIEDAALRRPRQ